MTDVDIGFGDGNGGFPPDTEDPDNDEFAKRYLVGFTDFSFIEFGDIPGEKAPIRLVWIWAYDYLENASISVVGHSGSYEMKPERLYKEPGRKGQVPAYTDAELKEALKDNCQVCEGSRGGTLGNENVVNGVVMCDYCHADDMMARGVMAEVVKLQ